MSDALHVVCPHCNAVNRIPSERFKQDPKCGKCHRAVFTGQPVELNSQSFRTHVDRTQIPLVIDFWAPWCGPCLRMAPHYVEAAGTLEPRVRFAKVNTETEQMLGSQFNIRSIPTLMLFQGGREVARQAGAMASADIVRWIEDRL